MAVSRAGVWHVARSSGICSSESVLKGRCAESEAAAVWSRSPAGPGGVFRLRDPGSVGATWWGSPPHPTPGARPPGCC